MKKFLFREDFDTYEISFHGEISDYDDFMMMRSYLQSIKRDDKDANDEEKTEITLARLPVTREEIANTLAATYIPTNRNQAAAIPKNRNQLFTPITSPTINADDFDTGFGDKIDNESVFSPRIVL